MTIYNRFQGDPAIFATENGADMIFKGGQPILDQGLENAAKISLLTKKGWWGNTLESEESKKIGSDFPVQRTIVDVQTINDYNDAASKSLAWLKNKKISTDMEVNVTNPYSNQIYVSILIKGFSSVTDLLFIKNSNNWISQANNPAHGRV